MKFSRNPSTGILEVYDDDGTYIGVMATANEDEPMTAQDGGPGSGNYGHSGRPGKVGGSAKGSGGSSFRSGSKETGYSSFVQNKLFKGIASHARASKDDAEFVHSMNEEQREALKNQWSACGSNEGLGSYAERIYKMLHERPGSEIRQNNKPVDGKNLFGKWKYEGPKKSFWETVGTKEIDTEIEDILHKQGFDGVPKIVSKTEFDKITKEHPEMPILFRSYAAPSPEMLDSYDNDLERGFFYVDCGEGGSGFGQGMYCAGVYPHTNEKGEDPLKEKLIKGAMNEMLHYRNLNIQKIYDSDPHVAPEGKTMLVGGSGEEPLYKYYDQKEFRSFDSEKPEEGQMIAYWDVEANMAAEGIMVYKNGKIDGTMMSWEPSPGDKWAPLEGDCEKVPLNPKASTRMMTLDPSAKIIKYDDLKIERHKLVDENRKKVDGYIQAAKEKFGDSLSSKIADKNGLSGEKKEKAQKLLWLYYFGTSNEDAVDFYDLKKEFGDKFSQRLIDEYATRMSSFKPRIPDDFQGVPTDMGIVAAMLGYDAINAVGHGESKSYTVVLNRTKLIISEERVDVRG